MDMIKKFFPFSFNVKEKDVNDLVVSIIIYVVAGVLVGLVLGLMSMILSIISLDWLMGIVGTVVGLYVMGGIVLAVLKFFNVLK